MTLEATTCQKRPFKLQCVASERLLSQINQFLVDRRSGYVQLNIRSGEILGATFQEIFTERSSRRS